MNSSAFTCQSRAQSESGVKPPHTKALARTFDVPCNS